MAFLKISPDGSVKQRRATKKTKKARRRPEGILYILKMELGETEDTREVVYKIGVTARKTRALESRVSEIATDYYMKYRFFPHIRPRKFSKTPYYYELEAWFHRKYKEHRYLQSKKTDGDSEFFKIDDEEELLSCYKEVMANPLEYITPTEKAEEVQDKVEGIKRVAEESVNDIDPVSI